jgi:hypothetical protein
VIGWRVLSELKQHLGTEADFCYPSLDKKLKWKVSTNEAASPCHGVERATKYRCTEKNEYLEESRRKEHPQPSCSVISF